LGKKWAVAASRLRDRIRLVFAIELQLSTIELGHLRERTGHECFLVMALAKPEYDVAWAKTLLKAAGLKSTASRIAVLRHLAAAEQPTSHSEIVAALSDTGIDQSTIFRTLQEFDSNGLATRLELGDQIRRFEFRSVTEPDRREHPHFRCEDCGEVTCLQGFALKITPSRGRRRELLGKITEVLLRGHCRKCLAR
jgi:Fur family ferric uptake transcriptional regulator